MSMQFSHDDLYQDRTWFDELGARLLRQCLRCTPRHPVRMWTTAFALFSAVCVAWAAGLATQCVIHDLPQNACLARFLAAGLLLVAARHFLAVTGLSAAQQLPRKKLVKRTPEPAMSVASGAQGDRQRPAMSRGADPQQFFRDVKAAGINLRIARALYAAGLRSGEQVRACEDAALLSIAGVGPATLAKLRVKFGLPHKPAGLQSNAA